ncbi:unnamed protein product [Mucor fragilis]
MQMRKKTVVLQSLHSRKRGYNTVMVKGYVGDFGTMYMTSLMMNHDPSVHTSMSPLITPAALIIPDIKKHDLPEEEKRAALQDKTLNQLLEASCQ